MDLKQRWVAYIHDLQNRICDQLEEIDSVAKFIEDRWKRAEGGGGKTKVISKGNVFEKGGVNTSIVFGSITDAMRKQLNIQGDKWFACGLSIVLHPGNPFIPTVHCNYRMFELYDKNDRLTDRWFGGGADLTPYYLFEDDAKHFHQSYKDVCDQFDALLYPMLKAECDNYFVNHHRDQERRGIGGIFYDYKKSDGTMSDDDWMLFSMACGNAFIRAYLPIVENRKLLPFTEKEKYWQEIRRGRYVEFNLVHDRGTLFGLRTNGRIESILMSLPPTVRFDYNYHPEAGSEEDKLLQVCMKPRDWV